MIKSDFCVIPCDKALSVSIKFLKSFFFPSQKSDFFWGRTAPAEKKMLLLPPIDKMEY